MPANRPSAAELLIVVREFLEQDIKCLLLSRVDQDAASGDGNSRALALNNAIAISMLKLLEREQNLRCRQQLDEQTLLRGYLGAAAPNSDLAQNIDLAQDIDALNAQLISVIEAPDFVDADQLLLRQLQKISLSKLAIDNPSYSTFRKHVA